MRPLYHGLQFCSAGEVYFIHHLVKELGCDSAFTKGPVIDEHGKQKTQRTKAVTGHMLGLLDMFL